MRARLNREDGSTDSLARGRATGATLASNEVEVALVASGDVSLIHHKTRRGLRVTNGDQVLDVEILDGQSKVRVAWRTR